MYSSLQTLNRFHNSRFEMFIKNNFHVQIGSTCFALRWNIISRLNVYQIVTFQLNLIFSNTVAFELIILHAILNSRY